MSLQRYINIDSITSRNSPQYAQIFDTDELQNVDFKSYIPKFAGIGDNLLSELHIYTFNGDYLGTAYGNKFVGDIDSNSVLIDIRNVFDLANIEVGSYKIVSNVMAPVYGNAGLSNRDEAWPVFIKEIAATRDEIKFSVKNKSNINALTDFKNFVAELEGFDFLNTLVVNFGENQVYKIINIRFDKNDQFTFYVKIYKPLDDEIEELARGFFAIEPMDPYIDTVTLSPKIEELPTTKLKGPNFNVDVDVWQSQATAYKSWNDLLDSNAQTTQQLIDKIISGSDQAILNIDYTDYNNYIFYGSAKERISNFVYKLELIEDYNSDINTLQSSSASESISISSSVDLNQNRIDTLVSNLDSFERWLYYHDTGSLFTHDISGSQTPYPKFVQDNKYQVHSVSSSIAQTWITSSLNNAEEYDRQNYNSLEYSIPEHVLMDDNNSEYITFVNMIGQHFDVMYSYVHALTQIHDKDEHPERGPSRDLLFHIAKSYGWTLQNTRQISDLWLYKLGTNNLGEIITSSNFDVTPHEEQTNQIWRRTVNNLPYLLKTKGTSRSVKALMSIYGIPQSLISIKEYGGPGVEGERPVFIEDTFSYALSLSGSAYITIPQESVSAKHYGWGDGRWCGSLGGTAIFRKPDTYEFRFRTNQSGSEDPIVLFMFQTNGGTDQLKISLCSSNNLISSSSISGSDDYGKILIETFGASPTSEYTDWLPLFDNDFWTIRLYNQTGPTSGSSTYNNRIHVARSPDCSYGAITHESAVTMSSDVYTAGLALLGYASAGSSSFQGEVQGYKEYFTIYGNDTFYNHVLNPRAYNTDSISGSFYSLYRYFPLGLDLQREDRSSLTYISSSHPDRSRSPSPATASNFSGDQTTQYEVVNETYYSEVPTLGGFTLKNEKIRLEDSVLKFQLSPDVRSEQAEYDDKPLDSSRLAIVFSLADHINRDIYNHTGFGNLDQWIGDPEDEFNGDYNILVQNRKEYFQKYTQNNDINAFIRILGLYDYTFFEQLKQLVPAKADLLTGVLIEPHILNRSKTTFTKKPSITNPQWDETITYATSQSGDLLQYEGEIESASYIDTLYFYETGSIENVYTSSIIYSYFTSSVPDPCYLTGSEVQYNTSSIEMIDPYKGFKSGSLNGLLDGIPVDDRFQKKICIYDAFLIENSLLRGGYLENTDEWTTSGSITTISGDHNIVDNVQSEKFKYGQHLTTSAFLSQSISTDSNKLYLLRTFSRPYQTSSLDAKIKLSVNGSDIDTRRLFYMKSGSKEWVNEYRFTFTGSGTDAIRLDPVNEGIVIYAIESYEYVNSWEEQWIEQAYKEMNKPVACIYIPWHYQIQEGDAQNRSRFVGSKLTGIAINVDSTDTVDGGPVVEIKDSNPNSLFIDRSGPEGDLRVD